MSYLRHTITVDFSGDHERLVMGIGIVIQESARRGRRGPIVAELVEAVQGIPFGEGEKYAVLRALEVASERGFRDLKIRSDYNAMRRKLKTRYKRKECDVTEGLDGRILQLAKEFDKVHFGCVPKRAHTLARQARTLPMHPEHEVIGDRTASNSPHAPEPAINV